MDYAGITAFAPLALYAQNRGDLQANLPDIVRRAQLYVEARLDHDAFSTELELTTIGADGTLDESDFPEREIDFEQMAPAVLEIRSVSKQVGTDRYLPLFLRDYEMLTMLYSDCPRGRPVYYAQAPDGGHRAFPAPGQPLGAKVRANVAPPILSPAVPVNLLAIKYPLLLQLAATREAAVFMVDEATTGLYTNEAQQALDSANAQIGRRTRDEAAQKPTDARNARGA